jgi:hypothetical protein
LHAEGVVELDTSCDIRDRPLCIILSLLIQIHLVLLSTLENVRSPDKKEAQRGNQGNDTHHDAESSLVEIILEQERSEPTTEDLTTLVDGPEHPEVEALGLLGSTFGEILSLCHPDY